MKGGLLPSTWREAREDERAALAAFVDSHPEQIAAMRAKFK